MSEEKKIFDKKFVYLEWDDVLKGKKVFSANTLPQLRDFVGRNYDSLPTVSKNVCENTYYPFISSSGMQYAMVYYDPNYSCKMAYTQGKTIQCRNKGEDKWIVTSNPNWLDKCEYRVKPESEMWTACIDNEGIVSVMPASDWNKRKGRQLIEGTEEKCKDYTVENYCKKCIHEVSICCNPRLGCQGFRELKSELQPTDDDVCVYETVRVCGNCKYKDLPYSCTPCKECMEDFVDGDGERSMWEPIEVKKRRMTNRELAKWLAQGDGERLYATDNAASYWTYGTDGADREVDDGVKIRGWDEEEWHEPEVEEE